MSDRRLARLAALGLALLVVAVFLPALDNGFVDFDDGQYVDDNPHVRAGLTRDGVTWALTATVGSLWHPLALLSHMLDVELYGLDPRGHHLTSLLLHAASTVLLFAALRRLTGATGRSALVAALFAVHPLRVESVVWIAERKDVLAALFWMLALFVYARYARRPTAGAYAALALVFAAGLSAKAMVVTLPAILLLLDGWPLGRLGPGDRDGNGEGGSGWRLALAEKVPLLALSGIVTGIAFAAGAGARQTLGGLGAGERIGHAAAAYVALLGKQLVPAHLAFFYPLREVPAGEAAACLALLAALTAGAVALRRRRPYLLVGWLWYLVAMLPVSGLFQIGAQAYADRYAYLPGVGLAIAVVWGLGDLVASRAWGRRAAAVAAVAVLAAMAVATRDQIATWRDSEALFRHATEVTDGNYLAHLDLGALLERRGEREEALVHLRQAVKAAPDQPDALAALAQALLDRGRPGEALELLRRALASAPDDPRLHHTAAMAAAAAGDDEEAIAHLRRVVALDPGFAPAHHGLGALLLARGDRDGALAAFQAALAADPGRIELYPLVAELLAERGRAAEAEAYRRRGEELAARRSGAAPEAPDPETPDPAP